jgi:hypothetical protein
LAPGVGGGTWHQGGNCSTHWVGHCDSADIPGNAQQCCCGVYVYIAMLAWQHVCCACCAGLGAWGGAVTPSSTSKAAAAASMGGAVSSGWPSAAPAAAAGGGGGGDSWQLPAANESASRPLMGRGYTAHSAAAAAAAQAAGGRAHASHEDPGGAVLMDWTQQEGPPQAAGEPGLASSQCCSKSRHTPNAWRRVGSCTPDVVGHLGE